MALVVNTNVSSLVAQRNLMESKGDLDQAMERLSSGKRINSASDDAAGLAISNRMESQIRGLNVAVRNANDGISLAQTAEGAMEEMTNMLQRMRELSLQSANSVNNELDRSAINDEVQQLVAEIDRVAEQTRFNDVALLDGSFQGAQIQVGIKANESIGFDIRDLSSSALGREANTIGSLANTTASAEGTAATVTKARLSFSGPDTYTFKVEGVTVQGELSTSTMTTDLRDLASTINDNLTAVNANTTIVAEALNGSIELRNTAGDAIAVTDFSSAGNGSATFDVLVGGGSSTYLNDTTPTVSTGVANGAEATGAGVRLRLTDGTGGGGYEFKINGVQITTEASDTDAEIQTKLENALGTGYEVYIKADSGSESAEWDNATTSFDVDGLVAGEFAIFHADAGKDINITEFNALDGKAAGAVGTIRVATEDDEALLVDATNQFTVSDVATGESLEVSLAFASTTSDYAFEMDGVTLLVTGDDLSAGTAGQSIIDQLNTYGAANTDSGYAAAGLGSLGNANTDGAGGTVGDTNETNFTFEVLQNGNQITIKRAAEADFTGAGTLGDMNIAIYGAASTAPVADGSVTTSADQTEYADLDAMVAADDGLEAFTAVAESVGQFLTNDTAGAAVASSQVALNDTGAAIFKTSTATATQVSLAASGTGSYTFKVSDGTNDSAAITTSVSSTGSASQMIADINAVLSVDGNLSGIVASADSNNPLGVILTRTDGGSIQLKDFSSPSSESILFSPSAGQGVATTLNDDTVLNSATASAAGLADATEVVLDFDVETGGDDFTSFTITDGVSTAVVRRTATDAANAGALLKAEIDRALTAAGMTNVTTGTGGSSAANGTSITFTDSTGGQIKIEDFVTDSSMAARWSPASGQGSPTVLDDNAGTTSSGVSIADISVSSTGSATSALEVIDNALQDVDDERAMLGSIQNRLTHTISNLTNISTNTSAAQSRIQDADFAVEAANLAKAQVLQQAGTSMLAQANASPQYVLSLLQ